MLFRNNEIVANRASQTFNALKYWLKTEHNKMYTNQMRFYKSILKVCKAYSRL